MTEKGFTVIEVMVVILIILIIAAIAIPTYLNVGRPRLEEREVDGYTCVWDNRRDRPVSCETPSGRIVEVPR